MSLNHLSNFSDPLTKQKDANRRKGVVGKIGRTTPMTAHANAMNPTITKIIFLNLSNANASLFYSSYINICLSIIYMEDALKTQEIIIVHFFL